MTYIAIDKAYIENRIAELEEEVKDLLSWDRSRRSNEWDRALIEKEHEIETLKGILSQSIEIPVEESWDYVNISEIWDYYPKGVIIKSS